MIGCTPLFPPFAPSNLRIRTGPSSPASPLSPLPSTAPPPILSPIATTPSNCTSLPSPAPPSPVPWVWYCHICHEHYPLAATRRCLHDGHKICFSPFETINKRTGKLKQRQPCTTEFDYGGWRAWNEWRRRNFPRCQKKHKQRTRDCCHKCDYPSQCANPDHSALSTPVTESLFSHNPQTTALPASPVVDYPGSPPAFPGPYTTFEQLLGPPAPATSSTSPATISEYASTTLDRLLKAAETRSAQLVTLLSPIQEDFHGSQSKPKAPTKTRSAQLTTQLSPIQEDFHASQSKPKTPTQTNKTIPPVSNAAISGPRTTPTYTTSFSKQIRRKAVAAPEISSSATVEDFQSFKARMDRIHGSSGCDNHLNPPPDFPSPGAEAMMPAPLRVVISPQHQPNLSLETSCPSPTEH
ncbi:hypothetical protein MMC29_000965 [Sticta canariensis]|nr:hypothetical protein [Sticta canariensis]